MAETLGLEVSAEQDEKEESPRFMMTRVMFSGVLFFL